MQNTEQSEQKTKPATIPIAHKVPEAAAKLGMCERSLWELIRRKEIGYVRHGRYTRLTDSQIQEYLDAHTVRSFDARSFAVSAIKKAKK